ncbi:MAG: HIT domain-containing protein [Candidatus Omnitrophota bacterium]
MDRIWAPWRKAYISVKKKRGCIFCRYKSGRISERKSLVLRRSTHALCILNRFPYNNGHVMVAPKRHVKSLELLKKEELADFMDLLNAMKRRSDKALKPDGYNIGMNLGKVGGAGFPGHVHAHIVPRWNGDTNFMPVIASTKVIAYSLDDMWNLLKG